MTKKQHPWDGQQQLDGRDLSGGDGPKSLRELTVGSRALLCALQEATPALHSTTTAL